MSDSPPTFADVAAAIRRLEEQMPQITEAMKTIEADFAVVQSWLGTMHQIFGATQTTATTSSIQRIPQKPVHEFTSANLQAHTSTDVQGVTSTDSRVKVDYKGRVMQVLHGSTEALSPGKIIDIYIQKQWPNWEDKQRVGSAVRTALMKLKRNGEVVRDNDTGCYRIPVDAYTNEDKEDDVPQGGFGNSDPSTDMFST